MGVVDELAGEEVIMVLGPNKSVDHHFFMSCDIVACMMT